jgi:hypothetical protein
VIIESVALPICEIRSVSPPESYYFSDVIAPDVFRCIILLFLSELF